MEYKGIVEDIIEKNGRYFFAVRDLAGVFKLPKESPLFQKLALAHQRQQPVTITHDANFNILDVT